MSPLAIPIIALIALLAGRSTPNADRFILLPDAEGKVGQIVISSSNGQEVLSGAYAARDVDTQGQIAPRQEDADSVHKRYSALLDARPPRPVSFTVHFVSGSASELTPESIPVIEAVKAALANRPAPEIAVVGHTDRVGRLEANDALSLQRAEAVRDKLVTAGVVAVLEVAGRGEREPLVDTEDEVAEPANRRVEINLR